MITTRTIEAFSHQVHWLHGSINTIISCHKQNNSIILHNPVYLVSHEEIKLTKNMQQTNRFVEEKN